ncbi:MAG TPA: sigma-70 family RNA polymerase sigma factor [Anaerolineae bacterium]|nr:sigma-70 family RNA polymerase sigma factor [Anaerolineae bacterium]
MSVIHEDGQLVARIRAGDLSALGALYDKYRLQVFHTALAITRDRQVAEDILQECFLKVHTYADRIDLGVSLSPWLYRVTVNLSYTWATRQAKWHTSLEGLLDRLVEPARQAPDRQFETRDIRGTIQRAIDALPFNQRVVVILHYLSGLDLKEIAYILDCPVGTVKSRLHYGRETLRRQLAGRLEPQATAALEMAYDFT